MMRDMPRGRRNLQAWSRWVLLALVGALGAALITACFDAVAGGGDATETGNALAGTVVMPDGAPAASARIHIVPKDFNPLRDGLLPESLQTVADARGNYRIASLPTGRYNVEARHPASGYRFLVTDIEISEGTEKPLKLNKGTVRAPGSLRLRRPDWMLGRAGRFFVPGSMAQSAQVAAAQGDGFILFDSLPAGLLPEIRFMAEEDDSLSYRIAKSVTVTEAKTQTVPALAAWPYAVSLALNTSSTGVALAADLTGFPLLVRLTPSVFDFSQARADGQDLRFEKTDGTALPFTIESWGDTSATIWVLLDTLQAGEASQHVVMRWGHSQATLPDSMAPVFDTALHFSGVWHLNETAKDTVAQGLYRDATPGHSHLNDRMASASVAGVIGQAQALVKGDYIQGPSLAQVMHAPQGHTLSIWFKADTLPLALGGEMLSMGDHFGLRLSVLGNLHTFFWPVEPPPSGQDPWYAVESQGKNYADGQWHLVHATYDGETLKIYADGQEVAQRIIPGTVDFRFAYNATLGRHGNAKTGFDYVGYLDEAQIHRKPRSLDWHRAAYENQKPGSLFPSIMPEQRP